MSQKYLLLQGEGVGTSFRILERFPLSRLPPPPPISCVLSPPSAAAATSALLEHKAFWLDCLPPPFLLSPLCIQRPSASSSRHDAYSPRKCHFKTLPFFYFTQTPFREPLAPKGGREGLKGGGEIKERRGKEERDFGEERPCETPLV